MRSIWLRRLAAGLLAPTLVGVLGAGLATQAFARTTVPLGPFRVQLDVGFGPGRTDIALPPLGELRADTHDAPLRLTATLRDVDVQGLQNYLRGKTLEQLAADVGRQAEDRLLPFALRTLAVGLAGALLLALVAFRRHARPIVIALLAALVALGGAEALTALTYDTTAFRSPTYAGTLSLAPQLFGPIGSTVRRLDYFQTELQRIVAAGAGAYAAVQSNPLGRGNEIRVLHISDIHDSPLGYRFAQELARGFDVNFVIDTGDVTSFGTPAEDLILRYVPGFHRPYVFVRGSHDSIALQAAMANIPNARVLDGTTATIDGITIYGLGDPYFVQRRGDPLSDSRIRPGGDVGRAEDRARRRAHACAARHRGRPRRPHGRGRGRPGPLGDQRSLPREHSAGRTRHSVPSRRDDRRRGADRCVLAGKPDPHVGRDPVLPAGLAQRGAGADSVGHDRTVPHHGEPDRGEARGGDAVPGTLDYPGADPDGADALGLASDEPDRLSSQHEGAVLPQPERTEDPVPLRPDEQEATSLPDVRRRFGRREHPHAERYRHRAARLHGPRRNRAGSPPRLPPDRTRL